MLLAVVAVLGTAVAGAQISYQPTRQQATVPTGACTLPNQLTVVTTGSGAGVYQCISGGWVGGAPGTALPTATASGQSPVSTGAGTAYTAQGVVPGYANTTTGNANAGGNLPLTSAGTENTAVGVNTLSSTTDASANNNTAIGYESMQFTNGEYAYNNTAIGQWSLQNNVQAGNSALGTQALQCNTTGAGNDALGSGAGQFNTTGYTNITVGQNAGFYVQTGSGNIAIGDNALASDPTGSNNTVVGTQAMAGVMDQSGVGQVNCIITAVTGTRTTAASETAIGFQALTADVSGTENVAVGETAMKSLSSGGSNTGVGAQAMFQNTTGSNNAVLGTASLYNNTSGTGNTAIGDLAETGNTTGTYNVVVGWQSFDSATTLSKATIIGSSSASSVTSGGSITVLGNSSLSSATSADSSTLVGGNAVNYDGVGANVTACTACSTLGYGVEPAGVADTNEIIIGYNAVGNGSNTTTIGNSGTTATYLNGVTQSTGAFATSTAQTAVNCSTSGTATFSQPEQGASDKKVLIHFAACVGTASYTFPTAFTNTPSVYASSNVAASIATSVSTTAVTVAGVTTTGSLVLEDY